MTVKYAPKIYADLYECPADAGGMTVFNYEIMRRNSNNPGYLTVNMSAEIGLRLANMSPYPEGVKIGVMKMIANQGKVTLGQMRVLLGWAARRAQHTGR